MKGKNAISRFLGKGSFENRTLLIWVDQSQEEWHNVKKDTGIFEIATRHFFQCFFYWIAIQKRCHYFRFYFQKSEKH